MGTHINGRAQNSPRPTNKSKMNYVIKKFEYHLTVIIVITDLGKSIIRGC